MNNWSPTLRPPNMYIKCICWHFFFCWFVHVVYLFIFIYLFSCYLYLPIFFLLVILVFFFFLLFALNCNFQLFCSNKAFFFFSFLTKRLERGCPSPWPPHPTPNLSFLALFLTIFHFTSFQVDFYLLPSSIYNFI